MSAQRGTGEATSITWDMLRALASFRASTGCAVSLYLDLDPQTTPTATDVQTRVRALVDEAGKRAEATRERRTHAQQASVREALEEIRRWFARGWSRGGARGGRRAGARRHYQRRVDNLADRHLRAVAAEIERVLSPPPECPPGRRVRRGTRAELSGLLSPVVRTALAGWTRAEAHAAGEELLASVKPVLERGREQREEKIVARWHDALGQSGRASAGWVATIDAASGGRVVTLLYAPGADHDLHCCPSCGRLELDAGTCPLGGAELEQCEDGLDALSTGRWRSAAAYTRS